MCQDLARDALGIEGAALSIAERIEFNNYWRDRAYPYTTESDRPDVQISPAIARAVAKAGASLRHTGTSRTEARTTPKSNPRDELTQVQTAAVEQALLEHQVRRRLSAGEQAMAARLGLSPCGFEGLKRAHAKATGTDGNVLHHEGVTDAEAAVARALGIDVESYQKHKAQLRAQLGLNK